MKPRTPHRRKAAFALSILALATMGSGCPCTDSVINSSPWLRWQIFAIFGADKLCDEMVKRGAPLRMSDGAPVIGRFFPSSCHSQLNDDRKTITVQFSGDGYAWTPVTHKMSFSSQGVVEFKPDFHKDGSTLYVWFRPVGRPQPTFNIGTVEQPVVGMATSMTPLGTFVNLFATQIMSSELGRGFTVIQEDSGEDFSLGILQPPQKPKHPYQAKGDDRFVVANETAEVHPGMLDFLGPFEIDSSGRSLHMQMRSARLPVRAAIVPREQGDAWRRRFQNAAGVPPPPAQPIAFTQIPADVDTVRPIALPKGQYYIVLDNPNVSGPALPASLPLLSQAARTSYLVWIADTK